MSDLQHLQKVILAIIKDVDFLCKKNDIKYYLLGGSAIGAIRHHGFIPWDDDLDIIMDNENYQKFIHVCRTQLDTEKYYIQEGLVDWPCSFSKIKLRGTKFEEQSGYINKSGECGIFLDIFKMENSPNSFIGKVWQYGCAKYLLCYSLLKRGWSNTTFLKKLMLILAYPLEIQFFRIFFQNQVEKWNSKRTKYYGFFSGRYRLNASFYSKEIFECMVYVPFEDTMLPVPKGYDCWLKQIFGDYMTLPPENKQVCLHLKSIDFGDY
jgi:lipopolysaccharide cholinephosphotransferase